MKKCDNDSRRRRQKGNGKKIDPVVLEVRDYQSLITKLRFRSAPVRDLSSICFLKSLRTLRLAHGSREKDDGTGKKRRERGKRTWELQSGNAPNTPSREPIVFTPSAKCRNPAIRIDSLFLFTSSVHHEHFLRLRVFSAVCSISGYTVCQRDSF